MKHITPILVFFLLAGTTLFAQTTKRTYQITSDGGVDNIEAYYAALENHDLDRHRLIDQSRIIRFDSGVEIELFSAEKLQADFGRNRNHSFMNKTGDEPIYPWLWSLNEDGRIIDKRLQSAINE